MTRNIVTGSWAAYKCNACIVMFISFKQQEEFLNTGAVQMEQNALKVVDIFLLLKIFKQARWTSIGIVAEVDPCTRQGVQYK